MWARGRVEEREAAPLLVGRDDWPEDQHGNISYTGVRVKALRVYVNTIK